MVSELTTPLRGIEAQPDGARYAILDQGAHVLHWQPPGQRPVLWTSAQSYFEPGKAIRGGIPVVFPWFGAGRDGISRPAHGYARVTDWYRGEVYEIADSVLTHYSLIHPAPGEPLCDLSVRFSPDLLEVALMVVNDTDLEVSVELALHTYLAVGDIHTVTIEGLDGARYLDTVAGRERGPHVQQGPVTFTEETDRLYEHDGAVVLHDPAFGRSIKVSKRGSGTTVVWNPWTAKAAAMPDFGDDEWTGMVCIEAACVRDSAITLAPKSGHTLVQKLQVLN